MSAKTKSTYEDCKKLRARLRLTQSELARKLGISARTVARWEADETSLDILAVRALRDLERTES